MEQWVLGMFREQLSKFIVGFRKEQVNANLLNGKGEITNIHLNCDSINASMSKIIKFVELESVHVSKLGFQVTSWTNLRKAPILVDIEHITIKIVEPLHYTKKKHKRKLIQQVRLLSELPALLAAKRAETSTNDTSSNANTNNYDNNKNNDNGMNSTEKREQPQQQQQQAPAAIKQRGAYNLIDRIVDNLALDIKSVTIQFQSLGRFKTRARRKSDCPWTPPCIKIVLRNLKFNIVNEFGQEASPDEVWNHNQNRQDGNLIIHKKLSMEYDVLIQLKEEKKDAESKPTNTTKTKSKVGEAEIEAEAGDSNEKIASNNNNDADKGQSEDVVKDEGEGQGGKEEEEKLKGKIKESDYEVDKNNEDNNNDNGKVEDQEDDIGKNNVDDKNKNIEKNIISETDNDKRNYFGKDTRNAANNNNNSNRNINIGSSIRGFFARASTSNLGLNTRQSMVNNDNTKDINNNNNNYNSSDDNKNASSNEIQDEPDGLHFFSILRGGTSQENKVHILMTTKRRQRDGATLAVQTDVTLPKVEVEIPSHVIPLLAHAAVGLRYCVAKDRAFEDPLKANIDGEEESSSTTASERPKVFYRSNSSSMRSFSSQPIFEVEGEQEDLVAVTEGEIEQQEEEASEKGQGDSVDIVDIQEDNVEVSRSEDGDEDLPPIDEEGVMSSSISSRKADSQQGEESTDKDKRRNTNLPRQNSSPFVNSKDDPFVLLFPMGIVIHEKMSATVSIEHLTVRGTYPEKEDGYIQFTTKGVVTDVILPKITGEKGGCAQLSVSFLSVQEKHKRRVRTILVGGSPFCNSISHPVEQLQQPSTPKKASSEDLRDENFPLYESRAVRDDRINNLRHTFPAQAVGLCSSVEFVKQPSSAADNVNNADLQTSGDVAPAGERGAIGGSSGSFNGSAFSSDEVEAVKYVHETGIDKFDITLDCEAWSRALRYFLNEDGGGFDPRWLSGDWTDCLTTDMLLHPEVPLDIEQHLQATKQIFLDGNMLISSDLFNVTARMTNIDLRLPAIIEKDLRSCDLVIRTEEIILGVSSALPRTFLTGKIGTSINGDDPTVRGAIDFPNDPSDICYALDDLEDPSIREEGLMTERKVSTFRLQLTVRGCSARIIPVIPFYVAKEPQKILAPTDMTMIICFEGEPPKSEESQVKIDLFISILIHRVIVNCDFELLAGLMSTGLYHAAVMQETFKTAKGLIKSSMPAKPTTPIESDIEVSIANQQDLQVGNHEQIQIRSGLKGRKQIVRKQFSQSYETGGLSITSCLQIEEHSVRLWRRNVPIATSLRPDKTQAGASGAAADSNTDDVVLPLVEMAECTMNKIEVGLECMFRPHKRRVVLKCCLSELSMKACDLAAECNIIYPCVQELSIKDLQSDSADAPNPNTRVLTEILSFGRNVQVCPPSSTDNDNKNTSDWQRRDECIAMRLEEQLEEGKSRSWSFASDIGTGGVIKLHIDKVEDVILLILEALLMPYSSRVSTQTADNSCESEDDRPMASSQFHSVGALLGSPFASLFARSPERDSVVDRIKKFKKPKLKKALAKIDKLFHDTVSGNLPSNVELLLFRVSLGDILIGIPLLESSVVESNMDDAATRAPHLFGILVHKTHIEGYYASQQLNLQHDMLNVLARKGTSWSSIVGKQPQGLYLKMLSRQSVISVTAVRESPESGAPETHCREDVIPKFEFGCKYSESQFATTMGKGLSINDLGALEELFSFLLKFAKRSTSICMNIDKTLSAVRKNHVSMGKVQDGSLVDSKQISISKSQSAADSALSDAFLSLRSAQDILARIGSVLGDHLLQQHTTLQQKEEKIEELQRLVFEKEKDRIGAMAIVSSRASGWLRMSGTHKFGERAPVTATALQYWVVLQKALLILYAGPERHKPVEFINLLGAQLHRIGGGRRPRDLKRAFALVDRSGITRFFVAGNDSEFAMWTRAIQQNVSTYSSIPMQSVASQNNLSTASNVTDPSNDVLDEGIENTQALIEGVDDGIHNSTDGGSRLISSKTKLNQVVLAAKAKGQAVKAKGQAAVDRKFQQQRSDNQQDAVSSFDADISERGTGSTSLDEGCGNDTMFDSSERGGSVQDVSERSSGLLTSKLKLNQVVQAAKAKGQAVKEKSIAAVEKRRQQQRSDDERNAAVTFDAEQSERSEGFSSSNDLENKEMTSSSENVTKLPAGFQLLSEESTLAIPEESVQILSAEIVQPEQESYKSAVSSTEVVTPIDKSKVNQEANKTTTQMTAEESLSSGSKIPQIRNRFSGAKNRFGSAMQIAKQKGKVVAEKTRQRIASADESVNSSFGSSQVGEEPQSQYIINSTAENSLKLPETQERPANVPKGEPIQSETDSHQKTGLSSGLTGGVDKWVCQVCTFENSSGAADASPILVCSMCDTPRPIENNPENNLSAISDVAQANGGTDALERDTQTTADVTQAGATKAIGADDDVSVLSDLEKDENNRVRDRLGAAVSGAAVRIVRRNNRGGPRQQSSVVSSDQSANKGGMFRFLRSGDTAAGDSSGSEIPSSVKLRNIVVANPMYSPGQEYSSPLSENVPLKKLEGNWFVRVKPAEQVEKTQTTDTLRDRTVSEDSNAQGEDSSTLDESRLSGYDGNEIETEPKQLTTGNPLSGVEQIPENEGGNATYSVYQRGYTASRRDNFSIQVFNQDGESSASCPVMEISRHLTDVVSLHTVVSECIAGLMQHPLFSEIESAGRNPSGDANGSLSNFLGLSALDSIRTTGKLLSGLLHNNVVANLNDSMFQDYRANVVTEFLDSVIACPLPPDELKTLLNFLCIVDSPTYEVAYTSVESTDDLKSMAVFNDQSSDPESSLADALVDKMLNLSTACEKELRRAETSGILAQDIVSSTMSQQQASSATHPLLALHPLLPQSTSDRLQRAMHTALMKVMAERDEAHARLVAASVLHVHEVEQQQKKIDMLSAQLDLSRKMCKSNNNNMFGGAFEDKKPKEQQEQMQKIKDAMLQNTDAELVALCQQLAGEISARTSAALELIRVKECVAIERETEEAEKKALQTELVRTKELLASEQSKTYEAQRESEKWKLSYERLLEAQRRSETSP